MSDEVDETQATGPLGRHSVFELVCREVYRSGTVSGTERALLKKLQKALKLQPEDATRILKRAREGLGSEADSPGEMSAEETFRKACELAWSDGDLKARELKILRGLAAAMKLSGTVATEILEAAYADSPAGVAAEAREEPEPEPEPTAPPAPPAGTGTGAGTAASPSFAPVLLGVLLVVVPSALVIPWLLGTADTNPPAQPPAPAPTRGELVPGADPIFVEQADELFSSPRARQLAGVLEVVRDLNDTSPGYLRPEYSPLAAELLLARYRGEGARDDDPTVRELREQCLNELWKVLNPGCETVRELGVLLADEKDGRVRKKIVYALMKIGGPHALEVLSAVIRADYPRSDAGKEAMEGYRRIRREAFPFGGDPCNPGLPDEQSYDATPEVQAAYAKGLERLGTGCASRDYAGAVKLLGRAARAGHPPAMYALAVRFLDRSWGSKEDGFRWLRAAAEKGYAPARFKLAKELPSTGRYGDEEIAREAYHWALQAAEQGHVTAMGQVSVSLAIGSGVDADMELSRRWLQRAAEGGHCKSMWDLGVYKIEGNRMPVDETGGRKLIEDSARKGHAASYSLLGDWARKGQFGPKDPAAAERHYTEAMVRGNEAAWYSLEALRDG